MEEADSRPFPGSPAHCEETAGSGTGSPDVPVVIFVADDHYAMPVAAAVSSVAANLDRERKAQVFIVDGGISLTNKAKVMRSENREPVRIQWLQPSESQSDLLKSLPCGYVGRTAYLKMLVPELLGPEYPPHNLSGLRCNRRSRYQCSLGGRPWRELCARGSGLDQSLRQVHLWGSGIGGSWGERQTMSFSIQECLY